MSGSGLSVFIWHELWSICVCERGNKSLVFIKADNFLTSLTTVSLPRRAGLQVLNWIWFFNNEHTSPVCRIITTHILMSWKQECLCVLSKKHISIINNNTFNLKSLILRKRRTVKINSLAARNFEFNDSLEIIYTVCS
jgi:hypothetical protein